MLHFKTTLLSYNIIVVTLLHTFKIELMVKQLGFSVSFCLFHHSACLFTPIPPWWRRALSPDCPGNMCQSLLSVSYEVCHMVSIRFSFIMVAIYHIWTFTFLKIYWLCKHQFSANNITKKTSPCHDCSEIWNIQEHYCSKSSSCVLKCPKSVRKSKLYQTVFNMYIFF